MDILHGQTISVKIFICGDIGEAKRALRRYCIEKGACVAIYQADYIYTGGSEAGLVVEVNNYPRFPEDETQLVKGATEIGLLLMDVCDQQPFMIQSNSGTTWYSRRKDLQDKTKQISRDKSVSGETPC